MSSGRSVGTGIATKATSNGGFAGYWAGAYQVFTAPPGASLQSVTFTAGAIRLDEYWTAGIVAYNRDTDRRAALRLLRVGAGMCLRDAHVHHRSDRALYNRSRFRFETRCGAPAGCPTAASGFTPGNRALFSAANVTVRVFDSTTPSIAPHRERSGGPAGTVAMRTPWTVYTDNVGMMITRMIVDGEQRDDQDYRDLRWPDWVRCDFTRPRPCIDVAPGGLGLNTAALADGEH